MAPIPHRERRVLIVSPLRNEAAHIELTARSLAAQTRPPDCWIAIDDGSDDGTLELLRSLRGEIPFLRVTSTPAGHTAGGRDRHALAASARAFNWALRDVDAASFTHLGKLDGDIELPPDYFERLLERFEDEPKLGIAGGTLVEPGRRGWHKPHIPTYHVRGAVKLYSQECFQAIGGVHEQLGWDTIDETYARMRGYVTGSFGDILVRHHRPVGTADGRLRGRARHGQAAYALRYGWPWVLLRSAKVALSRPFGLSGAAFVYGYARAAWQGAPRVEDEDFRRFVGRELRDRLAEGPRRLLRARRQGPGSSPGGAPFMDRAEIRTTTGSSGHGAG